METTLTKNGKLGSLTPELEELIDRVAKKYIRIALESGKQKSKIEECDIKSGIYKLYMKAYPEMTDRPQIIVYDSYIKMQEGYNQLKKEGKIGNTIQDKIWDYAWYDASKAVFDSMNKHLDWSVQEKLYNGTARRVGNKVMPVWDGLRVETNKLMKERKLETSDHFIGLGNWAGWMSFYDAIIQAGYPAKEGIDDIDMTEFMDLLTEGIWTASFFENIVLVCTVPVEFYPEDKAVKWRDGTIQNYTVIDYDWEKQQNNDTVLTSESV